ncbi:ATP-binding protein [Streptomyces sp. MAR4 CNX-425]|uniref:ATP-binding protein n=1 Tax=Streptomyces sp. MAR4 CNX-425 TaxID=3406343 RepID=UPI003B500264
MDPNTGHGQDDTPEGIPQPPDSPPGPYPGEPAGTHPDPDAPGAAYPEPGRPASEYPESEYPEPGPPAEAPPEETGGAFPGEEPVRPYAGESAPAGGKGAGRRAADPGTPGAGPGGPQGPARTARVVVGEYRLTVNPVDGTHAELCPPAERPGPPRRMTAAARAEHRRPPSPPPGPAAPRLPLLERDEIRERLVRLLSRGRSVRLTGPSGSGRTVLLEAVAADCAELAPDGVIRLSGRNRTPTDLRYELCAAVFELTGRRPDREQLAELLPQIGAVVVLDDVEFGGTALEELLDATPECAYLLAVTPDVPAATAASYLEEVALPGLGRAACMQLLERAARLPLGDEERTWAADLWFESEGLPLRFVQAGAVLRLAGPGSGEPLPPLAESAAPAALLASRLSEAARTALRFAVALGGVFPHHAQLPALAGEALADTALAELAGCGLVSGGPARYRLAAGVSAQLVAAGYDQPAEGGQGAVLTAAQHYAWWSAHRSVTPETVAADADAVLAALGVLVNDPEGATASTAVLLARAAAPAFAAALHWSAWERALRYGQEAARRVGEVAAEAYFHHELGVLALCTGNTGRARAELEAALALRGAISDRGGEIASRRALALVTHGGASEALTTELPALPAGAGGAAGVAEAVAAFDEPGEGAEPPTVLISPAGQGAQGAKGAKGPDGGDTAVTPAVRGPGAEAASASKRNLIAAGAGALLVAVLGTVVTLGMAGGDDPPADRGEVERSAAADDEDTLPTEEPTSRSPSSKSASPSPESSAPEPSAPWTDPGDETSSAPPQTSPSSSPGTPTSGGSSSDDGTTGGGSNGGGNSDGGTDNGGTTDGGTTTDGGSTTGDGGTTDGGTDDGGTTDGGTDDGGTTDGGTDDGGTSDGGTDNGGTADGGTDNGGQVQGTTTGTESAPSGTAGGGAVGG